jgi:hypothetical protein
MRDGKVEKVVGRVALVGTREAVGNRAREIGRRNRQTQPDNFFFSFPKRHRSESRKQRKGRRSDGYIIDTDVFGRLFETKLQLTIVRREKKRSRESSRKEEAGGKRKSHIAPQVVFGSFYSG